MGDKLRVGLRGVRASFLFDDRGRCGGRVVDYDMYPLQAFLDSAAGNVGLCVVHC